MIDIVWSLASRVFLLVFAGALAGRFVGKKGEKVAAVFAWASLYLLVPAFTLLSVWTSDVSILTSKRLIAAAAAVLAGVAGLSWIWTRARKTPFGMFCLPAVFMNSGYLAIPVNALLWGGEGAAYAIIYNMVVTVGQFTFGVWCADRRGAFSGILRQPTLYAVLAGVALNGLRVVPPVPVVEANRVVYALALPAMLLFMGYRLGKIHYRMLGQAVSGSVIRLAGGTAAGFAAVKLFGLSGVAAGVCVMTSSMPAAVNSYIFAEHYDSGAEYAAAVVFLSTMLSLATIPLLGALLA